MSIVIFALLMVCAVLPFKPLRVHRFYSSDTRAAFDPVVPCLAFQRDWLTGIKWTLGKMFVSSKTDSKL